MQFLVERIGNAKSSLSINFVTPTQSGFDERLFAENQIETIVCGHVGAFKGELVHTEMAHVFKKSDNGLAIISRFWIGQDIHFIDDKKRLLNKIVGSKKVARSVIGDKMMRGLAEHCSREYRNLAKILPDLHAKYGK